MLRAFGLIGLCLSVAACDSGGEPGPPAPPPPAEDEVVAGVNLTKLFAPPTQRETDRTEAVWRSRAGGRADRYAYVEVARGTDTGGALLVVFEGRLAQLAGTPAAHHVLLRVPACAPGAVCSYPLLLVSPRYLRATAAALLLNGDTDAPLPTEAAQAVVTLRGGTLEALGETFRSAVPENPYDFDSEDALAALDALVRSEALPQEVDAGRIAWAGFGRGGTIALLAAARDRRIDAVAAWAAPTSFLLPTVADDVERTLRGGAPSSLPAFDPLYRDIIFPIRGDSARLADARGELLLRSPLYAADALAPTLLVHSPQDRTVPFEHADRLDRELPPPPPFDLALFGFSNQEDRPDHDGTFDSFVARRTNAQFLAYHLDL